MEEKENGRHAKHARPIWKPVDWGGLQHLQARLKSAAASQMVWGRQVLAAAGRRSAKILRDPLDYRSEGGTLADKLLRNEFLVSAAGMLAFGAFTLTKSVQIRDGFWSILIPVLLTTMAMVFFLDVLGADRWDAMVITFLTELGVLQQSLLVTFYEGNSPKPVTSAPEILQSLVVSIGIGLLLAALVYRVHSSMAPGKMLGGLSLLIAGMYGLLMVAGRVTNGARLTYRFGPSFNVPQVACFLSVVALVLNASQTEDASQTLFEPDSKAKQLLNSALTSVSPWYKLLRGLMLMGVNTLCLAAANEYGTLLVLWIVFLAVSFFSLPARLFTAMALSLLLMIGMTFQVSKKAWVEVNAYTIAASQLEQAEERGDEAAIAAAQQLMSESEADISARVRYASAAEKKEKAEKVLEDALKRGTVQEIEAAQRKMAAAEKKLDTIAETAEGVGPDTHVTANQKLAYLVSKPYAKLYSRIQAASGNENSQIRRAREAMVTAGLFGSNQQVHVPVMGSDMVFTLVVLKLGCITGIALIALFAFWLDRSLVIAAAARTSFEQLIAIACGCWLTSQALLSAASASGVLPVTVGVGIPFLSAGNTGMSLSFAMAFIVMIAGRSRAFDSPNRKKVKR